VDILRPVRAFDRFQQRRKWLAIPMAVVKKFGDDQAGSLAALVAYYAFFSIFPLLLVATTVLGFLLRNHPGLDRSIVNSALAQFPVIGRDVALHRLRGSGVGLGIGIAIALWSGMGVFVAVEAGMNRVWGVPFARRPDFVRSRLRALGMLAVLGASALGATVLSGVGTVGAAYGVWWKVTAIALSTVIDVGLAWVAFRLLTARDVSWRQLRGGAIAAGVGWEVLQSLGGWYVGHELRNASNTYGTFATVIGLLTFIYLSAHVMLLAAEGNVVATHRLWPRSFSVVFEQPATDADARALRQRALVERRRQDETIDVHLG
jgi:membrane protein